MKKIVTLLILSLILVVGVSCATCDWNPATPQCDLYRGFVPEAKRALDNPTETEENKNLARRLLGIPTVEIQPTSLPIPQSAPLRPEPPEVLVPQSPLKQMEFKVESNCSWMGCVWKFVWGE